MVLFIGAKQFKSELYGTFSSLCKDPHNQVRKIMSSSYHEVREKQYYFDLSCGDKIMDLPHQHAIIVCYVLAS